MTEQSPKSRGRPRGPAFPDDRAADHLVATPEISQRDALRAAGIDAYNLDRLARHLVKHKVALLAAARERARRKIVPPGQNRVPLTPWELKAAPTVPPAVLHMLQLNPRMQDMIKLMSAEAERTRELAERLMGPPERVRAVLDALVPRDPRIADILKAMSARYDWLTSRKRLP